ncbi:hypothetical protein Nepgr_014364 [Nepenthes gracilis]|uniref:Uncharacterized protein n=1 Tax=Nepenthes gracilis TaxID=150966 RepID=A0AAD3XPS6_NEPGR|nr:hypothetical protein Nepgr_014364 [Nepenthes gracilis]
MFIYELWPLEETSGNDMRAVGGGGGQWEECLGVVARLPGLQQANSVEQALSNTRTDGFSALYHEGTASLLNSMADSKFPCKAKQKPPPRIQVSVHLERRLGVGLRLLWVVPEPHFAKELGFLSHIQFGINEELLEETNFDHPVDLIRADEVRVNLEENQLIGSTPEDLFHIQSPNTRSIIDPLSGSVGQGSGDQGEDITAEDSSATTNSATTAAGSC